jgi:transcriptional regulator with XRE-family HTH domain
LRKLRNEKGLTVDQVAERLLCSPSKVSRMETGQRGATLRDVRDLCQLYDVTDSAERDRLMALAREGRQQGWWQSYDLPYSTYVGLEAEAVSVRDYDSAVVPGPLQTADYVRALHEAAIPQRSVPELTPDIIDQRIEERLRRQKLLIRKDPAPLRFWVILDEAALHRVVGSAEVMKAQLLQLVEMSKLPNVNIQVIPYDVGAHPALDSTFNILDFDGPAPSIVYVEGLVGRIYLERPEDLDRYSRVFRVLSQMALSSEQSVELISKVSFQIGKA